MRNLIFKRYNFLKHVIVQVAFAFIFIGCGGGGGDIGEAIHSATYSIVGTVTYQEQPLSGVRVVLGGDKDSEVVTGQDGTYSFNFGEGHYTVNFYSDDYIFDKQGFVFKVFAALWGGGPSAGYCSYCDNKPWIGGMTATVNWEAYLPLKSESGIAYTGKITEAQIDTSNAEELAVASYLCGSYSDIGQPRIIRVLPVLYTALSLMNISMGTSDSGTVSGDCGGTANYTVETDSQGNFSGEAVFNNFCYEDMMISGTVNFSGIIEASGFILIEYIFDSIHASSEYFDPIEAVLETDNFELSGDITAEYDDPYVPFNITSNLFIKDTQTSKIYLFINYIIRGGSYTDPDRLEFSISGKVYHPDYGYFRLTQQSYFKIPTGENYPSSGSITISGDSSLAKLTAVSLMVYQIRVEIHNDFIDLDLDLGPVLWYKL